MSAASTITTAQQLLEAGDIGRCELIRGELKMMRPAGEEHGLIAAEIAFQLGAFVKKHKLGRVYAAETGFRLSHEPDTVRAPDVAFIARDSLRRQPPQTGYREGAPDLAVEVLSPDDRMSEVQAKVQDWLDARAGQVWVVDPRKKTISIYRPDRAMERFAEGDTLNAEDLLPGFELDIRALFASD